MADDSMDTIILDPELASIAQRVQTNSSLRDGTPSGDLGGPPDVQMKVIWKPHPLNTQGVSDSWDFTQKRVCMLRPTYLYGDTEGNP